MPSDIQHLSPSEIYKLSLDTWSYPDNLGKYESQLRELTTQQLKALEFILNWKGHIKHTLKLTPQSPAKRYNIANQVLADKLKKELNLDADVDFLLLNTKWGEVVPGEARNVAAADKKLSLANKISEGARNLGLDDGGISDRARQEAKTARRTLKTLADSHIGGRKGKRTRKRRRNRKRRIV